MFLCFNPPGVNEWVTNRLCRNNQSRKVALEDQDWGSLSWVSVPHHSRQRSLFFQLYLHRLSSSTLSHIGDWHVELIRYMLHLLITPGRLQSRQFFKCTSPPSSHTQQLTQNPATPKLTCAISEKQCKSLSFWKKVDFCSILSVIKTAWVYAVKPLVLYTC